MTLILSPSSLLRAEDYPAEYLGPGYRGRLSEIKQNGYYIEVFTKIDRVQKERVDKRNEIEKMVISSYQAMVETSDGISAGEYQHKYNADNLKKEIIQQRQQREQVASTNIEGGFTYIPYSDGKIAYFKDGLVTRIENERVVDESGNVSYRNSYNYQYDDKRLLTSFEADVKDHLGNTTHIRQYGMKYTADSLFYGDKNTTANKNIIEYSLEETDHAGNKKATHFYAGSYEGKLLRAFSQTIEDSIYGKTSFSRSNINYAGGDPEKMSSYHEDGTGTDGLAYTLDRFNITYNDKDQITSYDEVKYVQGYIVDEDGNVILTDNKIKTITHAQFKYLDVPNHFGPDVEEPEPDRILESIITTTTRNADGSERTETATTKYDSDGDQKLISAQGFSVFTGQEADWYQYTDSKGNILNRMEDKNGDVTYSYVDPDNLEVIIVNPNEVTATLEDGYKYKGSSQTQYEIIGSKPMVKRVTTETYYYRNVIADDRVQRVETSTSNYTNGLINNLQRTLYVDEHTETAYPYDPDNSHKRITDISLKYEYDEKVNLTRLNQVSGTGRVEGWEYSERGGWYGHYHSIITKKYEVILGKPVETDYYEEKEYID